MGLGFVVTRTVIWSGPGFSNFDLEVNWYLVGFQASKSLSGIVTTLLGISMTLPGIKGFCLLICIGLEDS